MVTLLKKLSWIAAGLAIVQATATAQPTTRLIVPYGAGGSTDTAARVIADKLSSIWQTPVVVENKPGAAGTVASRYLTTMPPDGKTLLLVTSAHAINALLYSNLPYDTLTGFTPIAQVTTVPNVLLTGNDSGYKTLADVLSAGRKNPDLLSYGTAGAGSSVHLAGELLSSMTGVKMVPVHFKGDSESIAAVVGGHIPLSFNTVSGALAQIDAGKVRALAVTGAERVPTLKDTPTMAEAGVSGYAVNNWGGILGPAGMDKALVNKINADIRTALADPEVAEKLKASSMYPVMGTPAEFDQRIRSDIDMWRPIITKLGLGDGTK